MYLQTIGSFLIPSESIGSPHSSFILQGKLRSAVDTPCTGLQCLVDVGATQLDGILEGVAENFCLWSRPHILQAI